MPVGPEGLTIGRGDENDLVLDAERASRRHARIAVADSGWVLEDLGSAGGTLLNGARVDGEPAPLRAGDEIVIEGERLRFLSGAETRLAERGLADGPAQIDDQTVALDGARLTIGRDARNDVVLDDPNVSRFHAELVRLRRRGRAASTSARATARGSTGCSWRARRGRAAAEIGIGPYGLVFDGAGVHARDDRGALRLRRRAASGARSGDRRSSPRLAVASSPASSRRSSARAARASPRCMKMLAGVTQPSSGASRSTASRWPTA